MAPSTPAADDSPQSILDQMDMTPVPKPFRSTAWKPSVRRNKNLRQILSETQRKEASVLASQNNSGASTPYPVSSAQGTDGAITPAQQVNGGVSRPQSNIAQAAQSLSSLVLEKNLRNALQQQTSGPAVTYTNIESAPSLHPAHQKHYCDITGLPAPYRDPKTRLKYHNREIFGVVRTLGQGTAERYLEVRGAHVVLK